MGGGNSGRPASVLWGGGSEGLVAQGFGYQATFAALETVVTERLNFHHIKDSLSSRASNSRTRPCADWNASEGSAFAVAPPISPRLSSRGALWVQDAFACCTASE